MKEAWDWFSHRLKELRTEKGFTQAELAEASGLTRDGVAQLESGRRSPAWITVVALAKALGVSCEAFLQPPADEKKAPRGRPPKEPRPAAEPPAPKRGKK